MNLSKFLKSIEKVVYGVKSSPSSKQFVRYVCINEGRWNSEAKYEVYWTIWNCWKDMTTCLQICTNPELSQIHDVFHVSILRRYRSNPTHVLKDQEVEILENLSYVEEPFKIIGYKIKKLRNRDIPLVKVLKKNHTVKAATGEEEKLMRNKYIVNFEDKIL